MNREETIALNARFDHMSAQHEVLLDMLAHVVKRLERLQQRIAKFSPEAVSAPEDKHSDGGPDA